MGGPISKNFGHKVVLIGAPCILFISFTVSYLYVDVVVWHGIIPAVWSEVIGGFEVDEGR